MTPKQTAFARNYARTTNIQQSARQAGYSEKYSIGKACQQLMQNPDIIAEIQRTRARLNESADKSATDVVNEFSKIAFIDRVDFLKEDPYYPGEYVNKSPDELTPDQRAIVEKITSSMHEITIIRDGEVEKLWIKNYTYVLADKSKALENMGRHFGIFDDKLRLTTAASNPFKGATPAQLEALKSSWITTMTDPKLIEGHAEEVKNDK